MSDMRHFLFDSSLKFEQNTETYSPWFGSFYLTSSILMFKIVFSPPNISLGTVFGKYAGRIKCGHIKKSIHNVVKVHDFLLR